MVVIYRTRPISIATMGYQCKLEALNTLALDVSIKDLNLSATINLS